MTQFGSWQPITTAPKDGTLVQLLIHPGDAREHPLEDTIEGSRTIGQNNFDNDGEDKWLFAGWCWEHDHYTQGAGVPTHWAPMLAKPASENQAEPAEPLYLTLAIQALNMVKAWRDSDGNEGFPHELREQIDALLIAYELRKHGTFAEQQERAAQPQPVDKPTLVAHPDKSGNLFVCIADGEGSHEFRLCRGEEGVAAFYEEMCGRDADGTLDSLKRAWADKENEWRNDGTMLQLDLYMAKFSVWAISPAEIERSTLGPVIPDGKSHFPLNQPTRSP